jgi:hypothetical protein
MRSAKVLTQGASKLQAWNPLCALHLIQSSTLSPTSPAASAVSPRAHGTHPLTLAHGQRRLEEASAEVSTLAPDLAECSELVQQMRRVGPDTFNRMKATLVAASDAIASIREIQRTQHPNRMRMSMRSSPATPSFPGGSASKPLHTTTPPFQTPAAPPPHTLGSSAAHDARRHEEEELGVSPPRSPSEYPFDSLGYPGHHDADWSPVYERLRKGRQSSAGGSGVASPEHHAQVRGPRCAHEGGPCRSRVTKTARISEGDLRFWGSRDP